MAIAEVSTRAAKAKAFMRAVYCRSRRGSLSRTSRDLVGGTAQGVSSSFLKLVRTCSCPPPLRAKFSWENFEVRLRAARPIAAPNVVARVSRLSGIIHLQALCYAYIRLASQSFKRSIL